MNFDDKALDEYLQRFTKRQYGDEPLSKSTRANYRSILKNLQGIGALENALKPKSFLTKIEEHFKSNDSQANNIIVVSKLLSTMSETDMIKHWSREDVTIDKVNEAIRLYRKEANNKKRGLKPK